MAEDLEPRTQQLLAAFKILEGTEDLRAIPLLARALSWRDPTLVAHDEALVASGLLELPPPFRRADAHVRLAAAKAFVMKWDLAAIAPLVPRSETMTKMCEWPRSSLSRT